MFGFHNRKDQGYLGNLRDRGHDLFYHYDATDNVTDLTDHLGSEVLKYRYDAFGGVFTQLWTPYNQVGLTGKSYDIKASLMDYSARWYSPATGRFTTADTWAGIDSLPQTLNKYAYALNNPVNVSDPTGHKPCYDEGDSFACGYEGIGSSPDDNWQPPAIDPTPTPTPTPDPGSGGGGSESVVPAWKNMQARIATLLAKAGMSQEAIDLVFEGLSTGADFIPGVGNLKALVETIVGFDLVTGKKFKWYERLMSGISIILPGAAALKNGLKAGLKASKIAVNAERTIEAENDIMKVEELSESALQRAGKAVESCNCFVGGTKVKTDEGEKNIEDIDVGDKVLSKDETTGEVATKEVTATFKHETDEIYKIHVGDQTIESTFNHPFWVDGKGWTFVKDLKPGDLLVQSDGNTLKIDSIELEHKQATVYNMTVDDFHTYFVSNLGIWVHNTSCGLNGTGKTELHHIATDKSKKFDFKNHSAFKETGINVSKDIDNLVDLANHSGRHTNKYHQEIQDRLDAVYNRYGGTDKLEGAVRAELQKMKQELLDGTLDPYGK
jgi:RHS repeat-associated protein